MENKNGMENKKERKIRKKGKQERKEKGEERKRGGRKEKGERKIVNFGMDFEDESMVCQALYETDEKEREIQACINKKDYYEANEIYQQSILRDALITPTNFSPSTLPSDLSYQRTEAMCDEGCPSDMLNGTELIPANTVVTFHLLTKEPLNLREISMKTMIIGYNSSKFPAATIRLHCANRKESTAAASITGLIFANGNMVCMSARTALQASMLYPQLVLLLQKWNIVTGYENFRIRNLVATCYIPQVLDIMKLGYFDNVHSRIEPSLFPGASVRLNNITANVFCSGAIALTGAGEIDLEEIELLKDRVIRRIVMCNATPELKKNSNYQASQMAKKVDIFTTSHNIQQARQQVLQA